jgi:Na+-driven multidrug efflux pump
LIPRYGILGAAIATSFSLGVVHILGAVVVYWREEFSPLTKFHLLYLAWCLMSFIIVFSFSHFLNYRIFHTLVLGSIAVILSLAGVVVLGISKEDRILVDLIKKKF